MNRFTLFIITGSYHRFLGQQHHYSNGGFFFLYKRKIFGKGRHYSNGPVFFLHLRCTVSLYPLPPPFPVLSSPLPPIIHPLNIFHFLTSNGTSLRRAVTFKVFCFSCGSNALPVIVRGSQGRASFVSTTLLVHRCFDIHRQQPRASYVGTGL